MSDRREFLKGLGALALTHQFLRSEEAQAAESATAQSSRSDTYVICEPCVGVKNAACVSVCPVDCIYEGGDQYFIDPGACIGCEACMPECPEKAIYPIDRVPDKWKKYIEKNRKFFG